MTALVDVTLNEAELAEPPADELLEELDQLEERLEAGVSAEDEAGIRARMADIEATLDASGTAVPDGTINAHRDHLQHELDDWDAPEAGE